MKPTYIRHMQGIGLIEVLVTLFILAVGLLGLAGLQARLQISEMESYQRSQALILLNDMANRIAVNRNNAASYVTGAGSPLGVGTTCPTLPSTPTRQERDASEWCHILQGAAETQGGSNLGAMIGARGCVENLGANQYMVTVAWQGLADISAPPASVACGQNLYNGNQCTDDLCRRAVTTIVRIGIL